MDEKEVLRDRMKLCNELRGFFYIKDQLELQLGISRRGIGVGGQLRVKLHRIYMIFLPYQRVHFDHMLCPFLSAFSGTTGRYCTTIRIMANLTGTVCRCVKDLAAEKKDICTSSQFSKPLFSLSTVSTSHE